MVVRNFFPPEVVEDCRAAAAKLVEQRAQQLQREGRIADLCSEAPLEKRLCLQQQQYKDAPPLLFRPELHMEELYELFFNQNLVDLMMELTDAEEVRLFPNYTMRPKMPSSDEHNVAWHQDAGLSPDGKPNPAPKEELLGSFGRKANAFRWAGWKERERCVFLCFPFSLTCWHCPRAAGRYTAGRRWCRPRRRTAAC